MNGQFHITLTPYWAHYLEQVNRTYERLEEAMASHAARIPVVIYTRVSTRDQAEEGYSLREQERACRQYAEQHGWQVREVYTDEGYSGARRDRPAFQRLLRDGQAGRFQGVLIHKVDRAYRSVEGMMGCFSHWQRQGIFLASICENLDFTTSMGKFQLAVLSAFAESFLTNLREETKKGLRGKFAEGYHNGWVPWGYCRGHCSGCRDANGPGYCPRVGLPDLAVGPELVAHPVDSQALRYAHRLYRSGTYSDRDIADALNRYQVETEEGLRVQVRSRGRPGEPPGPFTKEFCRDMLQNPIYTGVVTYTGSETRGEETVKRRQPQAINPAGRQPALISEAEFEQARQVRQARAQAPQGGGSARQDRTAVRQPARVYLLGGRLDCATCGAPLHAQAGGRNDRRHVCSSRLARSGACTQRSVKADLLEAELTAQMRRVRLTAEQIETVIGYLVANGGLSVIAAQREALRQHYERIRARYERGELGREVYLRERRSYERGLAALALDERSDVDLAQARALLADFGRLWELLTPLERKQIVGVVLRVALVDNGHVVAWHWYPDCAGLFAAPA